MAIVNLTDTYADDWLKEVISVCKSDSGIGGKKLRAAHMRLGTMIGTRIAVDASSVHRVAVVAMMRAGLPFALGIADGLEDAGKAVTVFFSTKEKPLPDHFDRPFYDLIVLSDAVIRTGKEILALADRIGGKKIVFATNVLDKTGIPHLDGRIVYTVRVSKNSFIGAAQSTVFDGKGPDTGDRLFHSDNSQR